MPSSQTLCRRYWQFSSKNGLIHFLDVDRGHHNELKLFVKNKRSFYKEFTSDAQGTNTGGNSRQTAASWIQGSRSLGVQRLLKTAVGRVFKTLVTPLLLHFVRFAHSAACIGHSSDLDATVPLGVHVPLSRQACLQ